MAEKIHLGIVSFGKVQRSVNLTCVAGLNLWAFLKAECLDQGLCRDLCGSKYPRRKEALRNSLKKCNEIKTHYYH